MAPGSEYRSVKVRKEVVERIERFLKDHPEYGHGSVSSFVTDSIRTNFSRLLEEIERERRVERKE